MTKGYTVHLDTNGKAACGVLKPRGFAGGSGLTKDTRRVTCPKCESIRREALAEQATIARLTDSEPVWMAEGRELIERAG